MERKTVNYINEEINEAKADLVNKKRYLNAMVNVEKSMNVLIRVLRIKELDDWDSLVKDAQAQMEDLDALFSSIEIEIDDTNAAIKQNWNETLMGRKPRR
jgi:S-adenosylmethionine:tRNA-ribosyltransferase-isomerase (queuine synthetase)